MSSNGVEHSDQAWLRAVRAAQTGRGHRAVPDRALNPRPEYGTPHRNSVEAALAQEAREAQETQARAAERQRQWQLIETRALIREREAQELIDVVNNTSPFKMGDRTAIQSLIQSKASVNQPLTPGQQRPLHTALEARNTEGVATLLELKAGVNVKSTGSQSPLHICCVSGSNVETIRLLLEAKADVNEQHAEGGLTALHMAARYGRKPVCEVLLAHKADITIKNAFGKTAVTMASTAECEGILRRHATRWRIQVPQRNLSPEPQRRTRPMRPPMTVIERIAHEAALASGYSVYSDYW